MRTLIEAFYVILRTWILSLGIAIVVLYSVYALAQAPQFVPQRISKQPTAQWVLQPVPHWSCAAPYVVTKDSFLAPPCELLSGKMIDFGTEKNEQIFLSFKQKFSSDGLLRVTFPVAFVRSPACVISGDKKHHIEWLDNERDHFLFRGKPGQELSFDCHGFIPRKP